MAVKQIGANVKKFLPSLAVGVILTLIFLLLNSSIYRQRPRGLLTPVTPRQAPRIGKETNKELETSDGGALSIPMRLLSRFVGVADDFFTDFMFAMRGNTARENTKDKLAVIAIDAESLQRLGSWPWSRNQVTELLTKIEGARVVGLDILFDERDKTSLANYVARFNALYGMRLDSENIDPELMNNDYRLALEVARHRTVVGAVVHNGVAPEDKPDEPIRSYSLKITTPDGTEALPRDIVLKRSTYSVTNLPIILRNNPPPLGEGYLNLFPTADGVIRNISLFIKLPAWAFSGARDEEFDAYPGFPLEMMRVFLGGNGYEITVGDKFARIPGFFNPVAMPGMHAVRSVAITRSGPDAPTEELLRIPVTELGEMEVSFRGRSADYQVYPAWEVMAGLHEGAFRDKMVIFGGTVYGVGHVLPAGLPSAEISVAEAHATILSSMLKRDFIINGYRTDYTWQQVMILLSGLAVSAALIFGSLKMGIFVSALILSSLVFINYFGFFRYGYDVGVTMPLLATLAVLIAQMVANYLILGSERRFIRDAFSLSVSPSILGYLEKHPDRLESLQGEHRDMTVLFSDIRGFTSISERMTAPDLARFLNEYFTPMSDIVMANMGTVDKFIGDAVMAFWNAPADNPAHARDAARSALDMIAKLSELQPGWTERGLPKVSIGCGINSGLMFAGYMGSEQRKNYTVMGDNVNIASRLEGLNKIYSSNILITDATRVQLGHDFRCRVVDKVRVSGKAEAVMIYELLGEGMPSEEEYEEIAAFSRVFELYQMREFAAAESLLNELLFIRPTPLYKMYRDRLKVYLALPPPPDWDGTFAMTQK